MMGRYQHGVSLVELMVGMTLSLILLLGLFQIFSSSKAAHNRVVAQARQQESGRFALHFLRTGLVNAGFRTTPEELPDIRFNDSLNTVVSGEDSAEVLAALASPTQGDDGSYSVRSSTIQVGSTQQDKANVLTTSDVITVRYQGGELGNDDEGTIRNCLGDEINQAHNVTAGVPEYFIEYAVDTYYVGLSTSEADGIDRFYLYCYHARWTSDVTGATRSIQGESTEKLVGDVVDLQVRLGIDTSGDNVVDTYQTFTDGPDMSRVRSVELTVTAKAAAPTDFLENRDAQKLTSTELEVPLREYQQLVLLRNLTR